MNQYDKMTKTPVNRLIVSLAVPTVISMLITNIYNLADAYFVGKINTSASGAIGVVLAIQAIIQAFGFMFGHGAGSIISRSLGAKDTDRASRFASTSFFLSIATGAVIGIVGLATLTPFMRLLGSSETILPYSKAYGMYILIAAPFMASSCVLNNIMRYEGRATLAMFGLTAGGILNIIGDPIFMFKLKMGIAGAGLSTALSQAISFFILLYMFLSGRTQSKLSIKRFTKSFSDILLILKTGFPSLIRQGFNSVSTTALNRAALPYGDAAIAAMSIVGRICMFMASVMIGIGQGLQPVAAYNWGAKKYSRCKRSFLFTFLLGEAVLSVFAVGGICVSAKIIGIFRDDLQVVTMGVPALQYQCIALILQPLGICSNMFFQSIGESKKASFLAMPRSGLYFLPLVLILPKFMGLAGVQSSQALADTLTFFTAAPMIIAYLKKIPNQDIT